MATASEALIRAIIAQESGGDPTQISPKGAVGLMQVMPATGRDPGFGVRPLQNNSVEENQRFGTDYFNAMLARYGGDRDAALIAYNGGPKRADDWIASGRNDAVLPAETANYYKQVTARLGGAPSSPSAGKPMDQITAMPTVGQADFGPMPSASKKALAQALMNQAFERSGNLRSPLGALSALAQLYAGSRIAGKEEEAANQRSRKLAEALMGATGNDQLIRTLFASGDPDLIKAGVASRIKTAEEAGHYGMNPVWVQKPDGSWGIAQLNSRGQPRIADFGEGITAAPPTFAVDTGTGTQITTRAGGQPVSTVKKDLSGAEREKAVGEGEGKAHLNVPAVEAAAARINRQLDAVRSDPNLPNVTGIESYMPTFLSKNKDTEAKIAQLGGSAFLQAFQDLRGGGAITDAEGAKATAALARLSESQSDAGFLQALDDFKREVQGLVDLARRKAGQAPAEVPPTAPPAAGNMRLKFNPETGELE